jgi:hypothetical protein
MKKIAIAFALLSAFSFAAFAEEEKKMEESKGFTLKGDFKLDYDIDKGLLSPEEGADPDLAGFGFDTALLTWEQKVNPLLTANVTFAFAGLDSVAVDALFFDWQLLILEMQAGYNTMAFGLTKVADKALLLGVGLDVWIAEVTVQAAQASLGGDGDDADLYAVARAKAKIPNFIANDGTDLIAVGAGARAALTPDTVDAKDVNDLDLNVFASIDLKILQAAADIYINNIAEEKPEINAYAEAAIDLALIRVSANTYITDLTDSDLLNADLEALAGFRLAPDLLLSGGLFLENVLTDKVELVDTATLYVRINWTPNVSF